MHLYTIDYRVERLLVYIQIQQTMPSNTLRQARKKKLWHSTSFKILRNCDQVDFLAPSGKSYNCKNHILSIDNDFNCSELTAHGHEI